MGIKEFSTAAKFEAEEAEAEEFIEFKLDDGVYRAYRPTTGQTAVMMSSLADYTTITERVAGTIDYFFGMLDADSSATLTRRLMDREDPFELAQINEIMSYLVEQWTGRPITPPSVSSRSRVNGGRRSTASARPKESIRSISESTGSAI
jgi:hypothetical protein